MLSHVGIILVTMSLIVSMNPVDLWHEPEINTTTLIEQEKTTCTNLESEPEPEPEPEPWWTPEEELMLSKLVYAEMGQSDAPDEAQQLVAQVVINRMRHESFPDTLYDVVYQQGQYACASYLDSVQPDQRAKDNALKALKGEVDCPDDVVWQSGFPQCAWNTTVKIYKTFTVGSSTVYFCHYGEKSS